MHPVINIAEYIWFVPLANRHPTVEYSWAADWAHNRILNLVRNKVTGYTCVHMYSADHLLTPFKPKERAPRFSSTPFASYRIEPPA